MELVIFILLFGFVTLFAYVNFTNKGKSWLFGGKLINSVNEKIGPEKRKIDVNIHVIEPNDSESREYEVGLELSQKSYVNFQTIKVKLSKAEARRLIKMLEGAANYEN